MGRSFLLAAALAAALIAPSSMLANGPLATGISLQAPHSDNEANLVFVRTRDAGATVARLTLRWSATQRPLNAGDPADPAYDWAPSDREIRLAVANGLTPMVSVDQAPTWAQDEKYPLPFTPPGSLRGSVRPDPAALGLFARAAAIRYSGLFGGLPRVRLWRIWNEPNLSNYLLPQFSGRKALSPDWYRRMLNAFADNVHAVHADNVVVGGNLSPFGVRTRFCVPSENTCVPASEAVAPLRFMRELLCLSKGANPHRICSQQAHFDAWGVHPYTSGGPTHHAAGQDDVSLGDLPDVRRLLDAGVRAGTIHSRQPVQLWATEFSWDTGPPDLSPLVVPITLHARWVAEALYRMWTTGVSLVNWLELRDDPYPAEFSQSGLYFRGGDSLTRDAPKPALVAFRFPFVAYREGTGTSVWGRTPRGKPARVVVERNDGAGWRRVATLATNRYGIFSAHLRAKKQRAPRPPGARQPRLPAATSYRETVLRDSPSEYWALDERSGLRKAHNLAGSRTGVYQGVKLGAPGALGETLGSAVTLNGKNAVVLLGPIKSPKTVELWLKTQTTKEAAAFSNRDSLSRYTFLGVSGAVRSLAFDTVGLWGKAWITDGRWHHLVYTYDGVSGKLYVDAQLDSSGSWQRLEGAGNGTLGYDATLKTYLRGSIDEVALYDYALTQSQVRSHFLASGRSLSYSAQFNIMKGGSYMRARLLGGRTASLPFSLTRPRDRFVLPFGR